MMKKRFRIILVLLILILPGCSSSKEWRTASRQSAGIAPDAAITQEAILQVYGTDAWGWRGWFAIHTWIASKRSEEKLYTVYDVVGCRGQPVLRIHQDFPDRYWFGEKPSLPVEHRGPGVDELVDAIEKAAKVYPWKNKYKAFPGLNSNSFTAWVAKQVPDLELELPFSAIGSSYVN